MLQFSPRIHVTVACGEAQQWRTGKCWLCDLLGVGGAKVILGIIKTNYSHTNINIWEVFKKSVKFTILGGGHLESFKTHLFLGEKRGEIFDTFFEVFPLGKAFEILQIWRHCNFTYHSAQAQLRQFYISSCKNFVLIFLLNYCVS